MLREPYIDPLKTYDDVGESNVELLESLLELLALEAMSPAFFEVTLCHLRDATRPARNEERARRPVRTGSCLPQVLVDDLPTLHVVALRRPLASLPGGPCLRREDLLELLGADSVLLDELQVLEVPSRDV